MIKKEKKIMLYGLLISLFIAGIMSLFASKMPDGLEKAAAINNFAEKAKEPLLNFPMLDYSVSFFKNSFISTAAAGISGTVAVFLLSFIWGKFHQERDK